MNGLSGYGPKPHAVVRIALADYDELRQQIRTLQSTIDKANIREGKIERALDMCIEKDMTVEKLLENYDKTCANIERMNLQRRYMTGQI